MLLEDKKLALEERRIALREKIPQMRADGAAHAEPAPGRDVGVNAYHVMRRLCQIVTTFNSPGVQ